MPADYICPEVAKLRAALAESERELANAKIALKAATRERDGLGAEVGALRTALSPFADPERGGAYKRAWEALHETPEERNDDAALLNWLNDHNVVVSEPNGKLVFFRAPGASESLQQYVEGCRIAEKTSNGRSQ